MIVAAEKRPPGMQTIPGGGSLGQGTSLVASLVMFGLSSFACSGSPESRNPCGGGSSVGAFSNSLSVASCAAFSFFGRGLAVAARCSQDRLVKSPRAVSPPEVARANPSDRAHEAATFISELIKTDCEPLRQPQCPTFDFPFLRDCRRKGAVRALLGRKSD